MPVLYGEPAPEAELAAQRGEIALGGCIVGDNDPEFRCMACGTETGVTALSRAMRRERDRLDQPDQELRAIHEAGHAVLGAVLGYKLDRVSIEPEGVTGGHVVGRTVIRSPVYSLAGYAAEEVLLDVPAIWFFLDRDGGDLHDALTILSEAAGKPVSFEEEPFLEAWARARAGVQAASRRIRVVARHLVARGEIVGEDAVKDVIVGRGTGWYSRALAAMSASTPGARAGRASSQQRPSRRTRPA